MDVESAYNTLNRTAALKTASSKIQHAYQRLYNFYQPTSRGVQNGKTIEIEEGIIQGWPLSGGFYDIGMQPLVDEMRNKQMVQKWMCDNFCSSGEPEQLNAWCREIRKRCHNIDIRLSKTSLTYWPRTRRSLIFLNMKSKKED